MKVRLSVLALGACLALVPTHGRAQSDTARDTARSTTIHRNPSASRNGPSTGISLGFSGLGMSADGTRALSYPRVVGLVQGGSGQRAGMVVGDTILAVNGRDARMAPIFPNRVPGARYVVRVRRGGEDREVILVLPSTPPAAAPRR